MLVANAFATKSTSGDSVRAWQDTIAFIAKDGRRKGLYPMACLKPILIRFVAYIGSSSGVEQTFSQCMSQFGHLRNYSVLGIERILVLASTRGQSSDQDMELYSSARPIWHENFGAPRRRTPGFSLRGVAAKLSKSRCQVSEAAAQRRRDCSLRSLCSAKRPHCAVGGNTAACLWGETQDVELKRQRRLQTERELEAASMGLPLLPNLMRGNWPTFGRSNTRPTNDMYNGRSGPPTFGITAAKSNSSLELQPGLMMPSGMQIFGAAWFHTRHCVSLTLHWLASLSWTT
jgi:hypothetical protein